MHCPYATGVPAYLLEKLKVSVLRGKPALPPNIMNMNGHNMELPVICEAQYCEARMTPSIEATAARATGFPDAIIRSLCECSSYSQRLYSIHYKYRVL